MRKGGDQKPYPFKAAIPSAPDTLAARFNRRNLIYVAVEQMFVESDLLVTLHLILLSGFVCVTSLLMLVTVTNRLRLRRVLLTWPSGKLYGLPRWPTLFVLLVLLLFSYSIITAQGLSPTIFAGYLVGGIFWFVSSVLSSTTVISDYGIILNINNAEHAIAWGQVVDYFSCQHGKKKGYVFFYNDNKNRRKRLELTIPPAHEKRFNEVVTAKLDARFEFALQQAFGKKALEG